MLFISRHLTCVIFFSFLITGCSEDQSTSSQTTLVDIEWITSSMQKLAPKGGYPRVIKLDDQSLLLAYENYDGDIEYKKSKDQGVSWLNAKKAYTSFVFTNDQGEETLVRMSNPEMIQLSNGDLLMACNYRPIKDEVAPFSIVVRRSVDRGVTWLKPQIVFTGEPRFKDGCWEPSFLVLPNGELHLYFANESPYLESDEQEIAMLLSVDNGKSWSVTPQQVSFREGCRDGMPVATLFGDEILLVIEDNKQDQFKPYILRTSLIKKWCEPILANSNQRIYALEEHMPDSIYMGAPYIITLPNGQVAISYQTTENRGSNWEKSCMEVAISDMNGEKFTQRSRPFQVPLDKEAKWNSMLVLNDSIVLALTSSNLDGGEVAPWMVRGKVKKIK